MHLHNEITLEKFVKDISVCDIVLTWTRLSDKERNSSRSRSLGFIVDHKELEGHLRYTG